MLRETNTMLESLPFGATWWQIQHTGASSWMQDAYEGEIVRVITNEDVPVNRGDVSHRDKKQPLWAMILEKLDPYATLYKGEQKSAAIRTIQERLREFVLSACPMKFGARKCRILHSWLYSNPILVKDHGIIIEFLQFLLDDSSIQNLYQDRSGNWFVKK